MTELIHQRAHSYAAKKHEGQMYGDLPYLFHLIATASYTSQMYKDDPLIDTLMAIAYLHDVAEDQGVTYEELVKEFGICIATSVMALTKRKGEMYGDYMHRVLGNSLARKVKVADTLTNMVNSFCSNRKKGMDKYPHQLVILQRGYV